MKFKAKPKVMGYEYDFYDWLLENTDVDGYIHGYYVDGHIVGKFVEVNNEYTHLEYWVPIQKDTLEEMEQ